jgi:hypothetical protein
MKTPFKTVDALWILLDRQEHQLCIELEQIGARLNTLEGANRWIPIQTQYWSETYRILEAAKEHLLLSHGWDPEEFQEARLNQPDAQRSPWGDCWLTEQIHN